MLKTKDPCSYLEVLEIGSADKYRWPRAQTIQVWTGTFYRTMIKTIKHKTSISVGRLGGTKRLSQKACDVLLPDLNALCRESKRPTELDALIR